MWWKRKDIKTPYMMFGLYLTLNGIERFIIEMMSVNITYGTVALTQAEIIAIMLIASGIILMIVSRKLNKLISV
jgi:prolipoprotein diacylglyceryltransferase